MGNQRARRDTDSAVDPRSVVQTMKTLTASSIEDYERSVRAVAGSYRAVEREPGVCHRQGAPAEVLLGDGGKRPRTLSPMPRRHTFGDP
jgi:hypothetical protein